MTLEREDFERLGLSPPTQEVLAVVQAMCAAPPMNTLGVDTARANAGKRQSAPAREEVHAVSEREIPVSGGTIRLRIYRPAPEGTLPCVVYFHAGGWILGGLDHSDHLCRRMANRSAAVVVNVDYRLAPEVTFPVPFDDSLAAVRWVRGNADEIGIDPARIALAGESSGGNLAAAVAQEISRQEGGLAFLLLLEPALDMGQSSRSWRELGAIFAPKTEQMAWMWGLYAPGKEMQDDPRVSPLAAPEIPAGHPATLVLAAEYDPLRDEAMAYADRLRGAGIPVEARVEQGLPHAFCNMGGILSRGQETFDAAVAATTDALREDR
ncbi:alpha/beta hydrolase [Marinovum sp.]|uniref:alpha/beta hydrolase n=1 Tax=Marinovum sp. TaxID=2024839 RepID=UPI003A92255C